MCDVLHQIDDCRSDSGDGKPDSSALDRNTINRLKLRGASGLQGKTGKGIWLERKKEKDRVDDRAEEGGHEAFWRDLKG